MEAGTSVLCPVWATALSKVVHRRRGPPPNIFIAMDTLHRPSLPRARRRLSEECVHLLGDLLPIFDFVGALFAAYLAVVASTTWLLPGISEATLLERAAPMALAGALLLPIMLRDRAFIPLAASGRGKGIIGSYLTRFLLFASVVGAVGLVGLVPAGLSAIWLVAWCVVILLLTTSSRFLLAVVFRTLERRGLLSQVVAIVGAGTDADRLVAKLQQAPRRRVDILGVFDDDMNPSEPCDNPPMGSIADLLELGKSQPMDWILLTRPDLEDDQPQSVVRRLKALSVPIALWSRDDSTATDSSLADSVTESRAGGVAPIRVVSPRWIVSLLFALASAMHGLLATVFARHAGNRPKNDGSRLSLILDNQDLNGLVDAVGRFGQACHGYIVTPNADHVIRLHRDPVFRRFYADATYTVLDSRFMARWLRLLRNLQLPVCTGSDLTARLFTEVIAPDDTVVLIGGDHRQAAQLRARFGLTRLFHLNPPMGFIHDPEALEACLQFVELHSPFRFCLLAVGSPQQEQVAHLLHTRGNARGMTLCIGAAINFLTGTERRAPRWIRRLGMEWVFRLLQNPRRMAGRYLLRGPQFFMLLGRTDIRLRAPAIMQLSEAPADEPLGQVDAPGTIHVETADHAMPVTGGQHTIAESQ